MPERHFSGAGRAGSPWAPAFAMILAAIVAACGTEPLDPRVGDAGVVVVDGQIRFFDLEGGCWALQVDDTTRFEPLGLDSAFARDRLNVRVALKPRFDMASVCMIGQIADVLWIRLR